MAISTSIDAFSKQHNKDGNGGGGITIIQGNGQIPTDLNINSIIAQTGNIRTLNGTDLNYNAAQLLYLMGSEGNITKLNGDEINYAKGRIGALENDSLKSGSITTDELSAIKAYVKSLTSESITTDYLQVNKQAHFFELVIDKVKAVGGTMMMTQAQCVADYVKALKIVNGVEVPVDLDSNEAEYYDVFFLAKDENNNREITNDWVINDQAYCQSFNNVSTNVNYDVSNKYYWRLVTALLQDQYMNVNNGAELPANSADVEYNSVNINTPYIKSKELDGTVVTVSHGDGEECFDVVRQSNTDVQWVSTSPQGTYDIIGTLKTKTTTLGIELRPINGLEQTTPTEFGFTCSNARLNIGIYYVDGSSEFFPAPTEAQTSYNVTLAGLMQFESIIITNADVVEWKLVHGIRLSNKPGECDKTFPQPTGAQAFVSSSIPSAGDNITQLGYRWRYTDLNEDESMKSRGNAIIIAAYKSPDAGCQSSAIGEELAQIKPPSYAQYEAIGSVNGHRFDLAYYRRTYMDGNGSKFYGKFYAIAGGTPQEIGATYVHIAYANSSDGQQDFTKTPAANVSYLYTGICSNTNQSDSDLVYSDYIWSKNSTSITYKLIDNGSQIYTKVYKDSSNNWKKSISASLNFKVLRMEGTNVRYMKVGEMRNWTKKFDTCAWGSPATSHTNYNGFFPYVKIRTVHKENDVNVAGYRYYRMALNDNEQHSNDDKDAVFSWHPISVVFNYNANEVTDGPNGNLKNYYMTINGNDDISIKLIEANLNATAFEIPADYGYYLVNFPDSGAITNNGKLILDYVNDGISLSINSQATSAISVLEDQISLRTSTTDSISELTVGVQGVQSQVTSGIQGVQSQISQTATGIQSQVSDSIQGVQSQIDVSTNGVQAYITNGLQSTGINITSGEINLQGNKVTFSASSGTQGPQSGKVWIDPDYGTLHAVNGDFSGKVTANLSYAPTTVINQSGNTIEKYDMNVKTDWTTSFKCNTQNNYIKIMLPKADDYDGIELNFYVAHSGTYTTLIYQSSNETSGTNHINGRPWVTLTLSGATFEAPDLGNDPFTASSIMIGRDQLITLKSMGGDWFVINGRATSPAPQAW